MIKFWRHDGVDYPKPLLTSSHTSPWGDHENHDELAGGRDDEAGWLSLENGELGLHIGFVLSPGLEQSA